MVSYFEIAGQIVESSVEDEDAVFSDIDYAEIAEILRDKSDYDIMRASQAPGRLRRARNAITLAATLAAADGPLPIGDMLAIGVLGGYAGYEIVRAFGDVRQ